MLTSGIIKQIESLRNSIKETISYWDVNYAGLNKKDTINVSDLDCVVQAYKIWLMSDVNDYHRNPGKGGFLVKNVIKAPLTATNAEVIKAKLITETKSAFPTINLLKCEVTANINRRRWEIRVAIQDTRTGLIDSSMATEKGAIIQYVN